MATAKEDSLEGVFVRAIFELDDWVARDRYSIILNSVLCRRAEKKHNIKFIDWKYTAKRVIVYESLPLK